MKVNLPFVKGSLHNTTDATRAGHGARNPQASGTAAASSGTPVALSNTARHLAQLSITDGDINLVRVNEIRDALAQGTLKINPERIADGLIASAQELVTNSK